MAKLQASTVPLGLLADLSKQKGKLHKQPDVVFPKTRQRSEGDVGDACLSFEAFNALGCCLGEAP